MRRPRGVPCRVVCPFVVYVLIKISYLTLSFAFAADAVEQLILCALAIEISRWPLRRRFCTLWFFNRFGCQCKKQTEASPGAVFSSFEPLAVLSSGVYDAD